MMAARACVIVLGFVLAAATTAVAEPVVLKPAASLELVDFAPIDGLNLQGAIAQNVAFGPEGESRVFYEFDLSGLQGANPRTPVFFQAHRTRPGFSSCAGLEPCPDLTRFDLFGYAGTGAIGVGVYSTGVRLARFDGFPLPGQDFSFDVTGFVAGLTAANVDFAGFAVRAASSGAMQLSDAGLAATPEPASLMLLTLGFAIVARRWYGGDQTTR